MGGRGGGLLDPYLTSGGRFRSEPLGTGARTVLWALLLAALALLFVEAGHTPLFEPDEGRYSEIPREMLATGDFVTPRINGHACYARPPLAYWAVAVSMSVFGETEWAVRLPAKLSAAGMVLATLLFARRRYGERVAVLAGLVVATSLLVVALGRVNLVGPPLSLSLAGAAFAFAAYQEHERSGNRARARAALYVLYLSCAAAVMLGGLVGIVLPGGAILAWALLSRRLPIVPRLFSPGPLVVFLALVLPWHVAVARRDPAWIDFYLVDEHFRWFFGGGHRQDGHVLFFVGVLLAGLLPWSVFLGRIRGAVPSLRRGEWGERGAEAFLHVFWILVLVAFSLSRSGLVSGILPLWPALAVLLALGLERARRRGVALRGERWVLGVLFGLLAGGVATLAFGARFAARYGVETQAAVAVGFLALGALLNLLPAGRAVSVRRPFPTERLALTVGGPWLGALAALLLALPAVARSITPWPLVAALQRELRADDLLLQRGHYTQVVPFYTKRLTPLAGVEESELDFGRNREEARRLRLTEEEFARRWNGPARVLCVVPVHGLSDFSDPARGLSFPHVLSVGPDGKLYLVANRP